MKAVQFSRFGGPEVLEVVDVPAPEPSAGEVVVEVEAVSIGRLLDLVARAGRHPYAHFQLPHVLGAEHAGVVSEVGDGVSGFTRGDRVAVFPTVTCGRCRWCLSGRSEACPELELIGVHRPGAYAELSCVPASSLQRLPEGVSAVEAAALALVGSVASNQLHRSGVGRGSWVVVQGASSGLGSVTASYARWLGAHVIALSRSAWKRERLSELGFDAVLDPFDSATVGVVAELSGGFGADVVIDDIGDTDLWQVSLALLAPCGTLVSSGAFLGGKAGVNVLELYSKNQRIEGIRTGNGASSAALWRAVKEGFRPVVDRTFPLEEASKAHEYLEHGDNFGRVLLVTQ
ncbi:MAG: alcohol dehydrogenase catalytic domain-containing protein [Actinobacteria bacterium]|nr:alcohol dehydrogenase catalytic domain-containing protein [Actinomycetota bacterium]